ncbi:hypothetical protein X769_22570 [Mesorhizobium sp. LSJC268A00]|uniref:hypothetical protein n=1 Tax=unclassified Mesorhizobium TaxID=325217 RepID=UPI0003CE4314|nr:hypothetical protein [Mesorhizobium sp. LSJC268A00]ESX00683.1 hypothetical protein X769_22570 [Mesorhizobium sp. LSJC268A00]
MAVREPLCTDDVFTDRWPENLKQQDEFAEHLKELVRGLEAIQRHEMLPDDMMDWLRLRFGDGVVTKAAVQVATEVGKTIQGSQQQYSRTGGILFPTPGIITGAGLLANPAVAAARPHTFFGKKI